jgi:hypothetical protein
VYEGRGVNRQEARFVAARVFEHLRTSDRSIGVITFNVAQQTAVLEELDRLRIENPEFENRFSADRLDNVFVKNLESVQGDERDVIVFSVSYGRDASGKFSMNFGPLNKDGGFRRLNVAITRARELVELVASVRAADFTLGDAAGRGPRMLEEYIRYAEVGGLGADQRSQSAAYADSKLESVIEGAVREIGRQAIPNVGIGAFGIDIGVKSVAEPSYELGIVTDGHSYRAIPTARDRDRLRESVLTELGWRVHRIWSLDWVRNREHELGRLRTALTAEARAPTRETAEDAEVERVRTEREVVGLREAVEGGLLEWAVPYTPAELPAQWTGYEFHESVNRDKQCELLVQLLEVEAPIQIDCAVRRLAEAWGRQRLTARVVKAAEAAIQMVARRKATERRGNFLWRPGQLLTQVRYPDPRVEASWRDIAEIPPEEIRLAMTNLIEMLGGVDAEQGVTATARFFGFERVGPQIRAVMEPIAADLTTGVRTLDDG